MTIKYVGHSYKNSTFFTPPGSMEYKGLKKWLGLAIGAIASIAVPFLAPAVATAFGGGFFASTIGQSLIGGAIGAIGGAAGQAIAGGDILSGALYGGIGGGLAGGAGSLFGGGGAAAAPGAAATGTPGGFSGGAAASNALGATGATGTTTAGLGSALGFGGGGLTDAFLQAAPGMAAKLFTTLTQPDQQKYLDQLAKELSTASAMNMAEYNQKLQLFNELRNEYANVDPTYAAQLAQATVMRQNALRADQENRAAQLRGGASYEQDRARRQRMAQIQGSAEAVAAYTNTFNQTQDRRIQGMAGLQVPSFNNQNVLAGTQNLYQLQRDANKDFGEDVGGMIRPLTYAFASKQPQQSAYG